MKVGELIFLADHVGYVEIYGCEIIEINTQNELSFESELTEDLISIIHHFSMKMYSNRRKALKEIEKQLKEE